MLVPLPGSLIHIFHQKVGSGVSLSPKRVVKTQRCPLDGQTAAASALSADGECARATSIPRGGFGIERHSAWPIALRVVEAAWLLVSEGPRPSAPGQVVRGASAQGYVVLRRLLSALVALRPGLSGKEALDLCDQTHLPSSTCGMSLNAIRPRRCHHRGLRTPILRLSPRRPGPQKVPGRDSRPPGDSRFGVPSSVV
jgi:hypothetical protein